MLELAAGNINMLCFIDFIAAATVAGNGHLQSLCESASNSWLFLQLKFARLITVILGLLHAAVQVVDFALHTSVYPVGWCRLL